MKRILLALAIFALILPATRSAEAGVDVSVDFFYNNLNSGGDWVEVGDYGYCWQPSVAVSNRDWRPYTDGYWAYTDVGWTWVSYEDFGWATYHYGRWSRVRGRGWVWVPGREWGPAWVSWRTGGDHVGWAPLPPRRGYVGGEVVYEGRPIDGYVDIDFDIGPSYYNFVDIRYIGEPVLRGRILPEAQNITYITNTVNVTNITYNNSTVYNYGPDYNRLSAYSTRPIQKLTLQRETNVDLDAAAKSGAMTKVQGTTLMVAGPQQFKAGEKNAAPKEVKTKIAKTDLETGWAGVSDEKQKAEMQAKMKKEDRKSIPAPQIAPQNPAALTAPSPVASAAAVTAPSPGKAATPSVAPSLAPVENGRDMKKGRGNDQDKLTPAPSVAPGASEARGKPTKEQAPLRPVPTPMGTPIKEPAQDKIGKGNEQKIDRKGRDTITEPLKPTSTPFVPAKIAPTDVRKTPEAVLPENGKLKPTKLPDMQTSERPLKTEKKIERQLPPTRTEVLPTPPLSEGDNGRGHGNRKAERLSVPQPPQSAPDGMPPVRELPAMHQQRQTPPPQMAPQRVPDNVAPQSAPQGKARGTKKDKGDEPAPSPEG